MKIWETVQLRVLDQPPKALVNGGALLIFVIQKTMLSSLHPPAGALPIGKFTTPASASIPSTTRRWCFLTESPPRNWEKQVSWVYNNYSGDLSLILSPLIHDSECLRSIKHQPRSISERIVDRFSNKKNSSSQRMMNSQNRLGRNPYHELEAAYVAQICLAWEALNWNYSNFKISNSGKSKQNCGYPANIAQQFQQFQVMLQRFIENEPYEYGTRPEIFCRMRISTPKLLQVPEFQGTYVHNMHI